MSDEQVPEEIVEEYDVELEEEDEERDKRGSRGIVYIIIAIVIVIIVFLLLRNCGGGDEGGRSSAGGKTIESVSGMKPADGLVSVWISEGADVGTVLAAAKVSSGDNIDMGGGRYVLSVPEGSELSAVKRLAKANGVHDAGLVYENAGSK